MKKRFLILISCLLGFICFLPSKKTYAYYGYERQVRYDEEEYQAPYTPNSTIIPTGMGSNIIDSNGLIKGSTNSLLYNGWIELGDYNDEQLGLYFNSIPIGNNCKIYVFVSEDTDFTNYNTVFWDQEDGSAQLMYYIDLSEIDNHYNKSFKYLSFCVVSDSFKDYEVEYLYKNTYMVCMTYSDIRYYNEYFYDTNYVEHNGLHNTFITSTSMKINLDTLKDNIKCSNNSTLTLKEDNYSDNYNKEGTYKVSYSINSTSIDEQTVDLNIYVVKAASIKYSGTSNGVYEYLLTYDMGSLPMTFGIPSEIYKDFNLDNLTNSTRWDVLYESADLDNDGTKDTITSFEQISKTPGTYKCTMALYSYYNGNKVVEDSYDFTINIIDDREVEVYVPSFTIAVSSLSTITNTDITNYISKLLALKNIIVSDVSVVSNEYENNQGIEGTYKVVYTYNQDGKTYTANCMLNVSNSNTSDIDNLEENNTTKSFNYSIIYISVIVVILVSISTYFIIKYIKNRKKD